MCSCSPSVSRTLQSINRLKLPVHSDPVKAFAASTDSEQYRRAVCRFSFGSSLHSTVVIRSIACRHWLVCMIRSLKSGRKCSVTNSSSCS